MCVGGSASDSLCVCACVHTCVQLLYGCMSACPYVYVCVFGCVCVSEYVSVCVCGCVCLCMRTCPRAMCVCAWWRETSGKPFLSRTNPNVGQCFPALYQYSQLHHRSEEMQKDPALIKTDIGTFPSPHLSPLPVRSFHKLVCVCVWGFKNMLF